MRFAASLAITIALLAGVACESPPARKQIASASRSAAGVVPFRLPNAQEIGDTSVRSAVMRGRAILEATRDSLPANVGNGLRCTSCHFSAGTEPNKLPWVGVYSRFPQYRARNARVDLIEDRINDCFDRSMNGHPIGVTSPQMRAIVTYMAFLSYGVPAGAKVQGQGLPMLKPVAGDSSRGRQLFVARCTRCHGTNGEGTKLATPLWGPQSFNIGAGMARRNTLAAFIHQAMPRDSAGTLSVQQAYDLAAFVGTRPRPDFPGKKNDWPNGGAPPDVPYKVAHAGK